MLEMCVEMRTVRVAKKKKNLLMKPSSNYIKKSQLNENVSN